MGGVDGTVATVKGLALGDALWDTARSQRTPIASPSYRRLLRYT